MTTAFAALKKIGFYGLSSGTPNNQWFALFKQIFSAYGTVPPQWTLKDGKVVNGTIQLEAKIALAQLADQYQKGYIDPDFVTGKDYKEKLLAGKIAYYDYGGVWDTDEPNLNSFISVAKKTNPEATIEFAPPPKGPAGEQGDWAWGTAGNIVVLGKQLEKQPEKLQRILEILETNMDEQMFVDLTMGQQGVHWDFNDPNKKQASGVKSLPPYDNLDKRLGMGLGDAAVMNPFTRQYSFDLYDKWNPVIMEKSKMNNFPKWDLFGKPDVLPSARKYWNDVEAENRNVYYNY